MLAELVDAIQGSFQLIGQDERADVVDEDLRLDRESMEALAVGYDSFGWDRFVLIIYLLFDQLVKSVLTLVVV